MKKIVVFTIFFLSVLTIKTLPQSNNLDGVSYTIDYYRVDNFSINNLPNNRFYKIEYNKKYIIDNKFDFAVLGSNTERFKIVYNNNVYFGDIDDPYVDDEPIPYFYKNNNQLYLLITQLSFGTDYRSSMIYKIFNGELIKTDGEMMQVDIVGVDYLLAYKSYWFIGYQTVESKIIINSDGKFERVGLSRFVDKDRYSPSKYYIVKKDITYNKVINNKVETKESILKPQQKIQLIETDLKTYVDFKTSNENYGRIKITCTAESGGDIEFKDINNMGLEIYFLDEEQNKYEIIDTVEVY